jgi:SMI1 / KNR4 family (SUKH-1)
MDSNASLDALISRVRARAADPQRRVDERPSELFASISSAGLGDLMAMLRGISGDLGQLRASGPNDAINARAEQIGRSMTTPAARDLPAAVSVGALSAAERELGVRFPSLLRRLYTEVGNGGFGPGPGLVGLRGGATTSSGSSLEDLYAEMLEAKDQHDAWEWPRSLVPVCDLGGIYACVDCASDDGRVIEFDFEELDEDGRGDGGWSRAFREVATSLEAWLVAWLDAPSAPPAPQFMIGPMRYPGSGPAA